MAMTRLSFKLAFGAAAAAVVVQAAAAAGIDLSVGERPDETRLAFRFPAGATVTPLQNGARLELRFSRGGDIDATRLTVSPPRFVRMARVASRAGQPLVLVLDLEDGVRQRHFVDGRNVVVDLFRPQPDKSAKPAAKPGAGEATGSARAGLLEEPGATRLTVRWSGPVRAAVFQRGQGAYLLFDGPGKIDISGLAQVGRRHRDIAVISQPGVTGVRLGLAGDAQVSARFENNAWSLVLAQRAERSASAIVNLDAAAEGGPRLTAAFSRAGVVRWVSDPAIGDRFAAAMIEGPPIGVDVRRATLEATLGPSAHGGLVEPRADDIEAGFVGNQLIVTRAGGLIAASAINQSSSLEPVDSLGRGGALAAEAWRESGGDGSVLSEIERLQLRAAKEGTRPGARADARLALAKYLIANELSAEALGALRVAQVGQPQLAIDPEFRLLRAAANVMLGRVKDANTDLSASGLARDPSAALWRGYAAALQKNWPEARRNLEAGREALPGQTRGWRARFQMARAEASLELGDIATAEAAVAAAVSEAQGRELVAESEFLKGRLALARGQTEAALTRFDQLAASPVEPVAVRAIVEAVRARRAADLLAAEKAVETLEGLRMRWRGDETEILIAETLGRAYGDFGRWRDGLAVMRASSARVPEGLASRRLRLEMGTLFERLFLEGEADKLEPIQALGLFYEFRELTPFGPQGDRIIRGLAGRLVNLDLLEQAAELLQHQIDNRLEGAAKAQIALDLAGIHLSDDRPEQALQALAGSRQPRLPDDLIAQRRIMEANVYLRLGRYDQAMEMVEKDRSENAQRVRAEALWRKREWKPALAALRPLLPPAGNDPLSDDQRKLLLRAAIAAVNSEDRAMLQSLDRGFSARMASTPDGDAFAVVAGEVSGTDARLRDAARAIAQTDLMDRFMTQMRARLTDAGPAPPA